MERFFGTLKESFYQEGALSVAELTEVIDDYIHYYSELKLKLRYGIIVLKQYTKESFCPISEFLF